MQQAELEELQVVAMAQEQLAARVAELLDRKVARAAVGPLPELELAPGMVLVVPDRGLVLRPEVRRLLERLPAPER